MFSHLDTQRIWNKVMDYVKPRVGEDVIETWFQPVTLEDIDSVQAKIAVPNKFFGEWLGRNYRDLDFGSLYNCGSTGPLTN